MDIIPSSTIDSVIAVLKILIFLIGLFVVAVGYFQAKEAKKMEKKLSINLPASIQIMLSTQTLIALIFLGLTGIILFLF